MVRKIVAIGGGKNGRIKTGGISEPYETRNIDKEIVRLTEKENPNFLFLAHAMSTEESEKSYFETMKRIYGDIHHCKCKTITKRDLKENKESIKELIEWADIIYESGGDTLSMINLWRETGFDKVLYDAWQNGKVMCGVSAGASCWFKSCASDSLKMQNGLDAPWIEIECLGFLDNYFVPHCNEVERIDVAKEQLEKNELVGILVSNCAAIEIVDNKYKIIIDEPFDKSYEPHVFKCYWNDGNFKKELIKIENEYVELNYNGSMVLQ